MSIIHNKSDFLKKEIPEENISSTHIELMYSNINNYVSNNVDDINGINSNMLSVLDNIASIYKDTMKSLGSITNSIANSFITGGSTKDSIDIFDKDVMVKSNGVGIDYDTMQVYLDRRPSILYTLNLVNIEMKNGSLGNTIKRQKRFFEINDITSSNSRLEIESYQSGLDVDINIDLKQSSAFNNIKFKVTDFGTSLPSIGSIAVSEDGCNFRDIKISTSNSFSMDINDFNFKNGVINIHVSENTARFIRINLIQKTSYSTGDSKRKRYAIGLNGLEVGFYSAIESGEVILGPFKSNDEILKVSAYSDMIRYNTEEPNVKLSISIDEDIWIPLQNSSVFDPESELSKIINFNNIDVSSIDTTEPVNKIFLKIEMQSVDVSYVSPESRYINRQTMNASSLSNSFVTESTNDYDFLKLFRNTDIKYGSRVSLDLDAPSDHNIPIRTISFIENDGKKMLQGLGIESDIIYDVESPIIDNAYGNIVIQFAYDKLHVERNDLIKNMPTMDFDPFNIKLYEFSSIIKSNTRIQSVDKEFISDTYIPVIPFLKGAGIYTLRYGMKSIDVDCKSGFFFDNREYIYVVDDEVDKVYVDNEIGKTVGILEPVVIDNVKYISLLDILDPDIENISNVSFNRMYPASPLGKDEYAIEFGKVVFGDFFKGEVDLRRVIKSEIETDIDKTVKDFKLTSESSRQIKASYQLLDSDLATTIKLKHTNILDQSVTFDISKAAINAFLQEVRFIDGQEEFELKEEKIQIGDKGANVIELDEDFIDDNSILFSSCSNIFQRRSYSLSELIDKGDYFIDIDSIPNKVLLPEDMYTDSSNETEIRYNIKPSKRSISGLYSIDHKRGVLHTVSDIDGETEISYKYSSVYASYPALVTIPKEDYILSSNNITITIDNDKLSKYLLLTSKTNKSNVNYSETPALLDFNLNIIDSSKSI